MCTYHIVSHQSDTILCFRWENSVWKAIQSSFSFSSSKSFRLFVLGPQSESWRWQIRFKKQKNLYFLVTLMVRRDGVSMTRRLVLSLFHEMSYSPKRNFHLLRCLLTTLMSPLSKIKFLSIHLLMTLKFMTPLELNLYPWRLTTHNLKMNFSWIWNLTIDGYRRAFSIRFSLVRW